MKKLISMALIAALALTVFTPVMATNNDVSINQTTSIMDNRTMKNTTGGEVQWECAVMALVGDLSTGPGVIFIIGGMVVAGCFGSW